MSKEKRRTKEEKISLRERLSRSLDIPSDLFSGECLVELRGRYCAIVKGGGKILTYTPQTIRIALKKGCLRIQGKRLSCSSYFPGAVGIEGEWDQVTYEEEA